MKNFAFHWSLVWCAVALACLSATASATTLTSPEGTALKAGAELHGANETGNTATIHIFASIPITKVESHMLCGTGNAKWEGSYVLTNPMSAWIDQN